MANRQVLDFSHLTPAERIELAEQLWDSLDAATLPLPADHVKELRERRTRLDEAPPGQAWREALDDLEKRGG